MVKPELLRVNKAFIKVKVEFLPVLYFARSLLFPLWHDIGKQVPYTNALTMKKNIILILTPAILLVVLLLAGYNFTNTTIQNPQDPTIVYTSVTQPAPTIEEKNWVRMDKKTVKSAGNIAASQEIIDYALSLIGSPYQYAGITPAGFDCSGFVTHVFDTYNLDVPHSSALQAEEGIAIAKTEAAPGDLVIFTGTNENVREPGHVGIVISEPGDTISFVHSSSNGGVKISKVQGTRYDVRFLEVRRVL